MANIKTVGPGKDYTTLQAWEDWADDQASADQWAECYAGSNLGAVIIFNWTATPDPTHFPRIYAPLTERHEGKDNDVGAYIQTSVGGEAFSTHEHYSQVVGLRFVCDEGGGLNFAGYGMNSLNGSVADSNLLIMKSTGNNTGIYFCVTDAANCIIRNNIIAVLVNVAQGIQIVAEVNGDITLHNNTVHASIPTTTDGIVMNLMDAPGTMTGEVKNNIVTGFLEHTCFRKTCGTISVTSLNNLSSDDTANDWGGSGHLLNKSADQFVDPDADWNLKPNRADAINTGVTIGTFDWDALHIDADNWRPQHGTWDMGALEYSGGFISLIKPLGGGDFTTLQAWEDWADDQASADQWAECYAGGNLGALFLTVWTSTPDAANYARIYTPLAERHEGKDNDVGAYIYNDTAFPAVYLSVSYTHMEGLRIEQTGSNNAVAASGLGAGGLVIDSNLIIQTAGAYTAVEISDVDNPGLLIIRNNIVVVKHANTHGIILVLNYDAEIEVNNNTIHKTVAPGANRWGILLNLQIVTITGEVKNNIITNFDKCYSLALGGGTFNATSLNNLSSDDTADVFGGSNHLLNKSADNQFVDKDSDWRLKAGADALDAGVAIPSFDWDALHLDADNWRPQ